MRGTAGQIALAEWLVDALDKPGQNPGMRRYRLPDSEPARPAGLPGGRDDVVRVFYPMHAGTAQRLQEIATQVRSMAEIRRLFIYNPPRAMALRGTASQIALADRLIAERDK